MENKKRCKEINAGEYDCVYNIMLPYVVQYSYDDKPKKQYVSVDKCLLPEILKLWELGIKTTGCCCGHGGKWTPLISVKQEFIPLMKKLGYVVRPNEDDTCREDEFIPKTILNTEYADKGFNWWEERIKLDETKKVELAKSNWLLKMLRKMLLNKHNPDLHSFVATTYDGKHLLVQTNESGGLTIFANGIEDFSGNAVQCCERLQDELKINIQTVEM